MYVALPSSQRSAAIRAGDVVDGRYRIVSEIADGGMGTVFLAEHLLNQRRIAIKFLHRELTSDTEMVTRFLNEALAAGTLGHPHIVEATDMGFTPDRVPYIVFEYLEGALLTDEIYRAGGIAPRRAVRLALQIASALDAAHDAGVVHLDLESDNVFLTERDGAPDHVKVLGFGNAQLMEAEVGQSERPDQVDKGADVYALGMLLYEMLAARRPLEPPPPLATPRVPAALARLVLEGMLAKEPGDRLASMREVGEALEAVLGALTFGVGSSPRIAIVRGDAAAAAPVAAAVSSAPALARTEPAALPSRRRARASLGAVAVVATAVLGFVAFSESAAVAPPPRAQVEPAGARDQTDARLAAVLAGEQRSLLGRADALAMAPMMRAAIETDAATIEDLARGGSLFELAAGETLQIALRRGGQLSSVLRLPAGSAAIAMTVERTVRVEPYRDGLRVVATVPVVTLRGEVGGVLAIRRELTASGAVRSIDGAAGARRQLAQ